MMTTPMDTTSPTEPMAATPTAPTATPTVPVTMPPPPTSPWAALARNPLRYLISSDPWRALGYVLTTLAFGWVCFGLYVVLILLPFAPLWSYYLAKIERHRVRLMRMEPIADPHPNLGKPGLAARIGERLGEVATWRETGYSLILAALAPVITIVFGVIAALALGLLLAPVFVPTESVNVASWVIDERWEAWLALILAIPVLVVAIYATAICAAALASLAAALLGPREAELERMVTNLRASRGILVDSFEGERRRIERDLHDGPQRDLVGVSMQLGELQLATDDESLRADLAAAQGRVEQALSGLRDTVRGVHPRVLDDHGVPAACIELGGTIPVRVSTGSGWTPGLRLPIELERAMYYTASEAVTNAVKHADAQNITITFDATPETVSMEIVDDGVGGADVSAGTGLAGLVERASAVGAVLEISSPHGGPTRLCWSRTWPGTPTPLPGPGAS